MGNFTTVPDVTVGENFSPTLWESAIQTNLNLGVMRQLGDVTLAAPAASIDFASIPADFAHLLVVGSAAYSAAAYDYLLLRLNGDATASYGYVGWSSIGGGALTVYAASASSVRVARIYNSTLGGFAFIVPQYALVTSHAVLGQAYNPAEVSAWSMFGHHNVVTAINQLTVLPPSGNLVSETRVTVYGLPA